MYFKIINMSISKGFLIFPAIFYPTFVMSAFVKHREANPITLGFWILGALFSRTSDIQKTYTYGAKG